MKQSLTKVQTVKYLIFDNIRELESGRFFDYVRFDASKKRLYIVKAFHSFTNSPSQFIPTRSKPINFMKLSGVMDENVFDISFYNWFDK